MLTTAAKLSMIVIDRICFHIYNIGRVQYPVKNNQTKIDLLLSPTPLVTVTIPTMSSFMSHTHMLFTITADFSKFLVIFEISPLDQPEIDKSRLLISVTVDC